MPHLTLAPQTPAPPEDGRWLAASYVPPAGLAAGAQVLDAACGSGLVGLCVGLRCPGVQLTGIDLNPALITLAAHNAAQHHVPFALHAANVLTWQPPHRFDAILCNPPFHTRGTPAAGAARNQAHHAAPHVLGTWLPRLAGWLKPHGMLAVLLHAQQYGSITTLAQHLQLYGQLWPLASHPTRPPKRMLAHLHLGAGALHTRPAIATHQAALRTAVLNHLCALPLP